MKAQVIDRNTRAKTTSKVVEKKYENCNLDGIIK
jgi:hypothetical protein